MASCFSWYTQLQGVLTIVSFFHTLINNLPVFLPSINICEIHHVLHRKAYKDSCDTDFKFFILNTILDLKNQRLLCTIKHFLKDTLFWKEESWGVGEGFSPQMALELRAAAGQSQKLLLSFPWGYRNPGTWAVLRRLFRHIRGQLASKHSRVTVPTSAI